MSDAGRVVPIGMVANEAGDTVRVDLDGGRVHLEVANEGREPVEVWLGRDDVRLLLALLEQAVVA